MEYPQPVGHIWIKEAGAYWWSCTNCGSQIVDAGTPDPYRLVRPIPMEAGFYCEEAITWKIHNQ